MATALTLSGNVGVRYVDCLATKSMHAYFRMLAMRVGQTSLASVRRIGRADGEMNRIYSARCYKGVHATLCSRGTARESATVDGELCAAP